MFIRHRQLPIAIFESLGTSGLICVLLFLQPMHQWTYSVSFYPYFREQSFWIISNDLRALGKFYHSKFELTTNFLANQINFCLLYRIQINSIIKLFSKSIKNFRFYCCTLTLALLPFGTYLNKKLTIKRPWWWTRYVIPYNNILDKLFSNPTWISAMHVFFFLGIY